jgi:3-phenylpropionate/cinnamic acid dioxygenase small subunit
MNQFDARVWVDKEEFHIARIDAKLKKPVTFLGGLAGAVNAINISVSQKRLASDTWVDESLSANFDARVFWKTYRFRMKSQSSHFKSATALGDNNRTKPLEEMTP